MRFQSNLEMDFNSVLSMIRASGKYLYGCVAILGHFKFYILICKIFLIDFLDELGNIKQKNLTLQNVIFFLHFKATDPIYLREN